jgi:hypothetical protein
MSGEGHYLDIGKSKFQDGGLNGLGLTLPGAIIFRKAEKLLIKQEIGGRKWEERSTQRVFPLLPFLAPSFLCG